MKGKFNLEAKFDKLDAGNCYISEMTLAELKFGIEKAKSQKRIKRH
jgi:tRNA(fMet)-specific endonuclease VapC